MICCAVVSSVEDSSVTDDSASPVSIVPASSLTRQTKDRRRSGLVQTKPQRGKGRVSQPPSCSLIEEMSNSGSKTSQAEELSSPNKQVLVSEAQSCALDNAAVLVHTLHNQESAENESPNIPRYSSRLHLDTAESLNDCYVMLEVPGSPKSLQHSGFSVPCSRQSQNSPQTNPVKTPQNSPFKVPQVSQPKSKTPLASPSLPLPANSPKSPQDSSDNTLQGTVASSPASSPVADSVPTPGKSVVSSPTKCTSGPKGTDQLSPKTDHAQPSSHESSQVAQLSSPGRSSQKSSSVAQRLSLRKSTNDKILSRNGLAENDSSMESKRGNISSQESSTLLLRTVKVRKGYSSRDTDSSKPVPASDIKEADARPLTDVEAGDALSERSGRKRKVREVSMSGEDASSRRKTNKSSADRRDTSKG